MTGFSPVIDGNTGIMIIGTFPGVKSLGKKQYYGHKQNKLWTIVYDIIAAVPPEEDYGKRLDFLLSAGIGLWDILKTCEREGSLDQAIRSEEANDFASLLAGYPGVRRLLFNGQKAWHWFKKYELDKVQEKTDGLPECLVMPSTSPAYTISYEKKKAEWEKGLVF